LTSLPPRTACLAAETAALLALISAAISRYIAASSFCLRALLRCVCRRVCGERKVEGFRSNHAFVSRGNAWRRRWSRSSEGARRYISTLRDRLFCSPSLRQAAFLRRSTCRCSIRLARRVPRLPSLGGMWLRAWCVWTGRGLGFEWGGWRLSRAPHADATQCVHSVYRVCLECVQCAIPSRLSPRRFRARRVDTAPARPLCEWCRWCWR
jgi:hypothetical protein